MVQDDVRALKRAGIGVVVVGPIRYSVGNDRGLVDIFDHTHFNLAVDPREPAETLAAEAVVIELRSLVDIPVVHFSVADAQHFVAVVRTEPEAVHVLSLSKRLGEARWWAM